MRKLILTAASVAALAVPAITPAISSAAAPADQPVTMMTHTPQHRDTTTVPTGTWSPGGSPVWAYDNLAERLTVTSLGGTQYRVAIDVQGSFLGFADPRTADEGSLNPGGPLVSQGSSKGQISYLVTSQVAPDKALVPAQEPIHSSIRLPITQMFDGKASAPVQEPGSVFTYNQVGGAPYTQIG